jgi:hypothetical protein
LRPGSDRDVLPLQACDLVLARGVSHHVKVHPRAVSASMHEQRQAAQPPRSGRCVLVRASGQRQHFLAWARRRGRRGGRWRRGRSWRVCFVGTRRAASGDRYCQADSTPQRHMVITLGASAHVPVNAGRLNIGHEPEVGTSIIGANQTDQ